MVCLRRSVLILIICWAGAVALVFVLVETNEGVPVSVAVVSRLMQFLHLFFSARSFVHLFVSQLLFP